MADAKLKPCPWRGKTPALDEWWGGVQVFCPRCHVEGKIYKHLARAIRWWNTRAKGKR